MDLLEYGMKNENDNSVIKRTLAKGALTAEKKRADLYEAYLNKKRIPIPEGLSDDVAMLQSIQMKINGTEEK